MLNRRVGVIAALLALGFNGALFSREVLPELLADDPPQSRAMRLEPGDERAEQFGIFDPQGLRIGTCWTRIGRSGDVVTVNNWVALDGRALGTTLVSTRLTFNTDLTYIYDERLSDLKFRVFGFGRVIQVHGEYVPPADFSCDWQFGQRRGNFLLPASVTQTVGDLVRPFDSLTGLKVGQRWRLAVLNPLAALMSGLNPADRCTDTIVIHVRAEETIQHNRRSVKVFRVESDHFRAWVTPEGRVLRQETEMPMFGSLTLADEPFNAASREQAIQAASNGG